VRVATGMLGRSSHELHLRLDLGWGRRAHRGDPAVGHTPGELEGPPPVGPEPDRDAMGGFGLEHRRLVAVVPAVVREGRYGPDAADHRDPLLERLHLLQSSFHGGAQPGELLVAASPPPTYDQSAA